MKKRYFVSGFIAAVALIILLGAALPAPIWRNNFSTNEPPYPVIGSWSWSNVDLVNLNTNFVLFRPDVIAGIGIDGGAMWELYGQNPSSGGTAADFAGGRVAIYTNASIAIQPRANNVSALRLFMNGVGTYASSMTAADPSGSFDMAYLRTNAFWATTNDFFATLQTTDNTTNNILTLTPRDNSVVRVKVDVVGYNSTASASYGKIGTFKSVAGTVTQVGTTATIGSAEDDLTYECLVDTSANIIRVRVAGNTGRTVNWKCYLNTTYSE